MMFLKKFIKTGIVVCFSAMTFVNSGFAQTNSGTLTDSRDGKTYRTVTIGDITWMAENLNYQTEEESWCYENNEANCAKWGRLYTFNAAVDACDGLGDGWRLAASADWQEIVRATTWNSTQLKSRTGWRRGVGGAVGTDDFGFSGLPGGMRICDECPGGGRFEYGDGIGFWASNNTRLDSLFGVGVISYERLRQQRAREMYYYELNVRNDRIGVTSGSGTNGVSVRCVRSIEQSSSITTETDITTAEVSNTNNEEMITEENVITEEILQEETEMQEDAPVAIAPPPAPTPTYTPPPQPVQTQSEVIQTPAQNAIAQEPRDRRTRFGLRVAPNTAIANVLVVSRSELPQENDKLGFGFEGGLLIDIPISDQWSFKTGASLIYRTPVNMEQYKASESALAVPILARTRWDINGRMFFSYYGLQADIAFTDIPDRNTFSIANMVIGFGISVGQNIEFDLRAVRSFDDFVDAPNQGGRHMEQMSIGFTYMFGN